MKLGAAVAAVITRLAFVCAALGALYGASIAFRTASLIVDASAELGGIASGIAQTMVAMRFAEALAWALIPYVVARAVEKILAPLPDGTGRVLLGVAAASTALLVAVLGLNQLGRFMAEDAEVAEEPARSWKKCDEWRTVPAEGRPALFAIRVMEIPETRALRDCAERNAAALIPRVGEWCKTGKSDAVLDGLIADAVLSVCQ